MCALLAPKQQYHSVNISFPVLTGAASPAMDVQALAEAMPPSATAYEGIAPPVKTIAEDTPYAVPATMSAG